MPAEFGARQDLRRHLTNFAHPQVGIVPAVSFPRGLDCTWRIQTAIVNQPQRTARAKGENVRDRIDGSFRLKEIED
jgi:hypothetical protein